ncbi:MAG: hypothetical protein ACRDIL_17670, partial [Candidatus Limnocylindrales bacterium]
MPRSVLRRAILSVVILALVPVAVVRAADVQPVVTLEPVAASAYRGETEYFAAHLSDGALGPVQFETSVDGITWESYSGSSQSGGSPVFWFHGGTVDGSVPLGLRYIRAHYPGWSGFLPADSEPQQQLVLIREAEITDLRVVGQDYATI